MPTPRFAGPPGKDVKQPPFKAKQQATTKKSGPQPPIPSSRSKSPSSKRFTKPGAPSPVMKGMGGTR